MHCDVCGEFVWDVIRESSGEFPAPDNFRSKSKEKRLHDYELNKIEVTCRKCGPVLLAAVKDAVEEVVAYLRQKK